MPTTIRDRFTAVMQFEQPADRLPMVEWAAWWDQTIRRWEMEGFPAGMSWEDSLQQFDLDPLHLISAGTCGPLCPTPDNHGAPIILNEADYERILPHLYPEANIAALVEAARGLKARHDAGEIIIRLWLDGFFWFPRTLLGIENHLLAFYDLPELVHRLNRDLVAFQQRTLDALFEVLRPDMVGFAEDMSYNNGPMLSRSTFNEFLLPYYRQIVPVIKAGGVKVLVDTDGQVEPMIPWLLDAGIEGVYPLERQSGVDVARIRQHHPRFLMLGGYDKMVMTRGEAGMRAEFERLLPVMRSGGFIPSVDHQTPPGVSLAEYRCYIALFKEYVRKAVVE